MAVVNVVAFSPALCLRTVFNIVSIAVGVSVIVAGVTVSIVVVKILNGNGKGSVFVQETFILRSVSALAFNRGIAPYELDSYYNAREQLLTITEQLNQHLKETFPNYLFIVVLNFSLIPSIQSISVNSSNGTYLPVTLEPSGTPYIEPLESPPPSTLDTGLLESSSPVPTELPSTSTYVLDKTSLPSSSTEKPAETSSTESVKSTDELSTGSYSSDGSPTDIFSTMVSLLSWLTSTISTPFQTTTPPTTTLESNETGNCRTSNFNGTILSSLVYLNVTIYFNTTKNGSITNTIIINALQSFRPIITLLDKCGKPSPAESTFNATKSVIQSASTVNVNVSQLISGGSIPPALFNATDSVTTPSLPNNPSSATTSSITAAATISSTTATTTTATTAPTLSSTTATTTTATTAPTLSSTATTTRTTTATTTTSTPSTTGSTIDENTPLLSG